MSRLRTTALATLTLLALATTPGRVGAADGEPAPPTPVTAPLATAHTDPLQAAEFQRLLDAAQRRDPQVRSAQALLQATRAQQRQARSKWFPTLGINANKTQSQDEDLGLPVERNSDRVDASLRWNLFAGGADLALYQALEKEIAAAELDLQRAREECAERVAQAYAEAVRAETVVHIAAELMARLDQLKALVDHQVSLGKSSDVDAQTSASSVLEVSVTHAEAQADARRARLKLSALTGTSVGTLVAVTLPPVFGDPSAPDWTSLREGNARWQAARQRAEAARTRLGPVMPELLPRVDLQIRRALSDRTTPPPTSSQRTSTTVGVSLEMPLGGENFAKRDEAVQRAEAALAESERLSLEAQIDWADAADKLATARYTLGIHQRQIAHLERVLKGAAVQYEAGRRTLVQLIELQKMPFATRQKMADSALTQFLAQVRMLSLSGGLLDALAQARPAPPAPAGTLSH